ncbi:hypothetical protein [Metaplanococcus flavidus]|uniref:hypothetical protein n=1 Tax=Metaplanococcus flavidus TaxID=569883 RepID=UPI001193F00E
MEQNSAELNEACEGNSLRRSSEAMQEQRVLSEPPAVGTATSCRADCMTHILWARKQAVLRNIGYYGFISSTYIEACLNSAKTIKSKRSRRNGISFY